MTQTLKHVVPYCSSNAIEQIERRYGGDDNDNDSEEDSNRMHPVRTNLKRRTNKYLDEEAEESSCNEESEDDDKEESVGKRSDSSDNEPEPLLDSSDDGDVSLPRKDLKRLRRTCWTSDNDEDLRDFIVDDLNDTPSRTNGPKEWIKNGNGSILRGLLSTTTDRAPTNSTNSTLVSVPSHNSPLSTLATTRGESLKSILTLSENFHRQQMKFERESMRQNLNIPVAMPVPVSGQFEDAVEESTVQSEKVHPRNLRRNDEHNREVSWLKSYETFKREYYQTNVAMSSESIQFVRIEHKERKWGKYNNKPYDDDHYNMFLDLGINLDDKVIKL